MKKAIAYIRVANDEQASLEVQKKLCLKEAKNKGYKTIQMFEDKGYSGATIERPGLIAMLSKIKDDPSIETLFVKHTDRLARDVSVYTIIRNEFRKYNVKIFSSDHGSLITNSPEDNFFDAMLAVFNAYHCEMACCEKKEKQLKNNHK